MSDPKAIASKLKDHAWLARFRNAKPVPCTSEGDVRLSPFVANQIAAYIDELIAAVLDDSCPECGGSGAVDSGGVREDGWPIPVPCGRCSE